MKIFRWQGTGLDSAKGFRRMASDDVLLYFGKHKVRFHCRDGQHAQDLMDALCARDTNPTLICGAGAAEGAT